MGFFSSIGSVLGGAVGSAIPGVGTSIGAALGGALGAGIEGQSAVSGSAAASQGALEAREATLTSSQERVDVARDFLKDWESIYGGIEDNLSSFFSSLTPERFIAVGLENFQKEFQVTKERINQTFAQRGIPDSGLEIGLDTILEVGRAGARAEIRTDAPFKVAEAQSKFLALGLPLKPGVQAGFTNALQARTNVLQSFASGATTAAAQAATDAGSIIGGAEDAIGTAAGELISEVFGSGGETITDQFPDVGDFLE